jgi:hypothetical protein
LGPRSPDRPRGAIPPDAHSWIDARFGEDDPLLFDADYLPKPAYFGARAALAAGGR